MGEELGGGASRKDRGCDSLRSELVDVTHCAAEMPSPARCVTGPFAASPGASESRTSAPRISGTAEAANVRFEAFDA